MQLIVCPNCEKLHGAIKGINILGRIEPDGGFLILRFHSAKTIIYGEHFQVMCGNCKEIVYIHMERRENGTVSYHGSIGLFGTALVGTLIQGGTTSYSPATGTIAEPIQINQIH